MVFNYPRLFFENVLLADVSAVIAKMLPKPLAIYFEGCSGCPAYSRGGREGDDVAQIGAPLRPPGLFPIKDFVKF